MYSQSELPRFIEIHLTEMVDKINPTLQDLLDKGEISNESAENIRNRFLQGKWIFVEFPKGVSLSELMRRVSIMRATSYLVHDPNVKVEYDS